MGFFDRLFGRGQEQPEQRRPEAGQLSDEQAIERYRYMLRTAPPELIEQAHEEAFAKLTPAQRSMVLRELTSSLPPREAAAYQDDPRSLARMATRAELRQPGTLERTFNRMEPAPGMGGMGGMGVGMGMIGGSFLSSLAGAFVGSMIAQQFFEGFGGDAGFDAGSDQQVAEGSEFDQQVDADQADLQGGELGGFDDFGDVGDFDSSI